MKKYLCLIFVALSLVACGSPEGDKIIDDLIEADIDNESPEIGEYIEIPDEKLKQEKNYSALDNINVDENISILPQSLAFAQVQRMMYYPSDYEGLTVKITGTYYCEVIPTLDIYIRAVMLMDETSCCQGYFELEFPEGTVYPDLGEEVMLVGTYTARNDGEYDYGVLKVSDFIQYIENIE